MEMPLSLFVAVAAALVPPEEAKPEQGEEEAGV
jgi:hypothetical protein